MSSISGRTIAARCSTLSISSRTFEANAATRSCDGTALQGNKQTVSRTPAGGTGAIMFESCQPKTRIWISLRSSYRSSGIYVPGR